MSGTQNTRPKYQFKRNEVYLVKDGAAMFEVHIIDVVKDDDGGRIRTTSFGWETAKHFVARHPVRMGTSKKFLGIIYGIKRD